MKGCPGNVKEYEGYWKGGKYHGKGKTFDHETGNVIYDGEFANAERHGYGVGYFDKGRIVKGTFNGRSFYKGTGRHFRTDIRLTVIG